MGEYFFECKNDAFKCFLMIDDKEICKCQINVSEDTWCISSWYTAHDYEHKGYGKQTMKKLVEYVFRNVGKPNKVEYIWNGTNSYVYDWLETNFGAISKCPIAVQKTQSEDDWDSHVYYLNVEKFLLYFGM